MGIMSAVIATEADVSDAPEQCPGGKRLITDSRIDDNERANLHLCGSVHRNGYRGSMLPIRTVWLEKLVSNIMLHRKSYVGG